jgi:hypothetical protein
MNRHATTRAIFLAGMVFASSAFAAGNDIKKCVTESGHVTLTDEVCPNGSHTVKIISAPASAEAEPGRDATAVSRTAANERYTVARIPARYLPQMKSTTPSRGLALDITTLRAARANMQMFDNASQSLRMQRIAGLQ